MIQDALKKAFLMFFFIVLARYLSTDEFGSYQQLTLIAGLLAMIFSAGIPVSISYFYGQTKSYSGRNLLFKRFFCFQILLLLLGVGFLLFLDHYLSIWLDNPLIEQFSYFIIVLFVTTSSIEFFKNLCTVTNQLKHYLLVTSLVQLLSVICNIGVVLIAPKISYILFVTVFFNLVLTFILFYKNSKYFRLKTEKLLINKVERNYILAMGSVALVSALNGYVDQVMVSIQLTTVDYANLKIGSFQIPFISVITGSLLTVMIPIISEQIRKNKIVDVIDTWVTSIEKATVLLVPIVIFCLFFAYEIIISFFGEKYNEAVIIFQVYMFQWLRAVVIFGGVMGAIGLEKKLFKNTLIISMLNILLNYFLIKQYGVIGAAIATTFLNYFGALLLIKDINKRLKRNFFSYFPFKIYAWSIFISVALCCVIKLIASSILASIPALFFFSIGFYCMAILIQTKLFYNDISLSRLKALL
jgi:O-antigen/teichoic acid export membrane protein